MHGYYYCPEMNWKSDYYADAIIWSIMGYTVFYNDPYDLNSRILLS